jgi:hypothetical protein
VRLQLLAHLVDRALGGDAEELARAPSRSPPAPAVAAPPASASGQEQPRPALAEDVVDQELRRRRQHEPGQAPDQSRASASSAQPSRRAAAPRPASGPRATPALRARQVAAALDAPSASRPRSSPSAGWPAGLLAVVVQRRETQHRLGGRFPFLRRGALLLRRSLRRFGLGSATVVGTGERAPQAFMGSSTRVGATGRCRIAPRSSGPW